MDWMLKWKEIYTPEVTEILLMDYKLLYFSIQ